MIKAKKFGTFGGVFTPSILTILGVIMYMRLPMIAGEAGLFGTLGIILVAHIISITTGLSVSSIATDKKVKEGGTYYIISRSLGLPIGGTLGLALFVGLSFSVSLYLIGFSESFLSYLDLPMDIKHIRIAGTIILLVVTIITFISTSLAIKAQYLIMLAIFLSLLSILFGRHDMAPVSPNLFGKGTGIPLVVLFGIFFPAVTGFEAGVSMSGDLRDPKKSIPHGTISAIAIGLVVYIGLAFFYSFMVDGEVLATDPKALFKIALVPQLVIAGIWGATLSSALGSILAAPRILQSTAIDKITPRIFAHGTGASKEPRNALLLTFLVAEAGILIGELDVIARIVSIFFITTYGFLNLSAAFESLTSADFRPSFKTPPWVSIIGSLACLLVMVQLDFLAMVVAVVILGSLFLLLKQRQLVLETGDTWSSVWATLVRTGLQRLNKTNIHTRNWRPNIILFSGPDQARPHLIELANSISGKLGMYSAFEMVESTGQKLVRDKRYFGTFGKKDEFVIHQHKCHNIYEGIDEISRIYGFSGIEPDTILMGWSKKEKNKEQFLRLLRNFEESNFNSILLNYNSDKKYGEKRTIDVWWSGWGGNLTISIFLLRHLTSDGDWKDAHIRLLLINNNPDRNETINQTLQQILNQYRINFEIKIINNNIDNLPKDEIISRESSATDLTFIGIPDRKYKNIGQTYDEVKFLTQHLGTFLLINSSTNFESFELNLENAGDTALNKPAIKEIELPEIIPSKYNIINEDVTKIDINGQKVLELFFEKAFNPVFSEAQKMNEELKAAISTAFTQLGKLKGINETYRRRKIIIKIKNDFYFQVNRIFSDLENKKLILQKEALVNGINWYIKRLDDDLDKFPLKLIIPYEREDLILKKRDPWPLKWFILRKRLAHPFSKKPIPGKIRYYEIVSYYLRDNRHYFLSAFLNKFQTGLLEQIGESRGIITSVDTALEKLLNSTAGNDDIMLEIKQVQDDLDNSVKSFCSNMNMLEEQVKNRLIVEFRKNLQLMNNDMAKADINYRIRRKRRNKKFYEELAQSNSIFPELWFEQMHLHVNKIHMDMIMQSFKNRIKDKINELNLEIDQQLDNRFRTELKEIRLKLERSVKEGDRNPELKTRITAFEESITLLDEFYRFGKDIIKLAETLPETMVIASSSMVKSSSDQAEGSLNIPLRRLARYYIESRFIGSTFDQLEKVAESLKNSIFILNDLLSLTRFNFENIPDELPDRQEYISPVIIEVCQQIQKEEEKIDLIRNNITELINKALEEVFDNLNSYKVSSAVDEYLWFIRENKGKKVKKTIDAYFEYVRHFFKNLTLRMLYSRSEWILLAKKIMESEHKGEGNNKILDLIESINPKEKVIEKLPQYYKKLFSGRSSIGEDFWISRETDEEMFRTGVNRIKSGYKGGIVVVGERNSGKTAFCRYTASKLFMKENVYHVFPIYTGSVQVSDFLTELSKTTGTEGNLHEVMEAQSPGSVFVIHDLELWWERSLYGCEVIKVIINLIKEYSKRFIFVANINPYAYDMMNKMVNLQEVFISVIHLKPFDSKEIQEMIIRRHRSSGLKFVLKKSEEENLSEIRMVNLFNKYFNFSEGNPGTALKTWLFNIVKVSGNTIFIRYPSLPDTKILSELDDDWKTVLIQLVLHKRLSYARLNNIFSHDETRINRIISALLRTGLIEERNDDLFIINTYIEPHLIKVLRKEELL
ncbi:MAG: amino acid permease [Bacteroidales bacterium]|nr:amino acid permease [Bacteroidales bacterium]